MLSSILFSAGLLLSVLPSGFEEPVIDTLDAVIISADKGLTVSRKDTLVIGNSFSISEVLMRSSGFHVGDNGGFAGLKSLSLRGLGSAHTAVYIDGVKVGNVQSGQNDLGMIGVDNFSEVVLDYAQNSVSFNTARPSFGNLDSVKIAISFVGFSKSRSLPFVRRTDTLSFTSITISLLKIGLSFSSKRMRL